MNFFNQEVKSFELTNLFLTHFWNNLQPWADPNHVLIPKISSDLIEERNEKLKFLYRSLLINGQDLDFESCGNNHFHTLSTLDLLQIKALYLEDKTISLYQVFRSLFLKLFILNHAEFLKNLTDYLKDEPHFILTSFKDITALVTLAEHLQQHEEILDKLLLENPELITKNSKDKKTNNCI